MSFSVTHSKIAVVATSFSIIIISSSAKKAGADLPQESMHAVPTAVLEPFESPGQKRPLV